MDVVACSSLPENHTRAINLAEEGVPVMAIARALALPCDEVYEVLRGAIAEGVLVEMPAADWPPHTRMQRTPQYLKELSDDLKLHSCMNFFKIPRTQAVLLLALISRPYAPREYLHSALLRARKSDSGEDTDIKMVDVVLCHLRRRLKPFNVKIDTVWGVGYHLDETSRDSINNALEQHVRGIVAPQETPDLKLAA